MLKKKENTRRGWFIKLSEGIPAGEIREKHQGGPWDLSDCDNVSSVLHRQTGKTCNTDTASDIERNYLKIGIIAKICYNLL